jgi:hypothetical protein
MTGDILYCCRSKLVHFNDPTENIGLSQQDVHPILQLDLGPGQLLEKNLVA